jgi:N4-gp56 family major capsid protein
MATDAYNVTGTDSFTTAGSVDFSKAAYDRMAYFALRPELYFDQAADVQPTAQSMPGSSVAFTIVNDLSIASSALTESNDVAVTSMSDSQVTLTLAEYGNAVLTTAKLRGTAFVDIDPVVANVVGYNAGVSLDTIARSALDSGTNVMYASGLGATALNSTVTARSGVTAATTLSSLDIRVARARLRSQNVPTFGGYYVGYIHPDLVADLQGETISGSNIQGWRAPLVYSQPGEIWTGELGAFEGVRWIETPRAPVFQGAGASATAGVYTVTALAAGQGAGTIGSGTFTGTAPQVGATLSTSGATVTGTLTVSAVAANTFSFVPGTLSTYSNTAAVTAGTVTVSATGVNVYGTVIIGRQALAKAHSYVDGNGAYPHVVPGPITDRLRRFVPMGWYWLGAYGIFRQASVMRIESSSLLGADLNTAFNPAVDDGESGNPQA